MNKQEYVEAEEHVVLEVIEDLLEGLSPEDPKLLAAKYEMLTTARLWQGIIAKKLGI